MGSGPPDPGSCLGSADVGNIYHDEADDIWYERVHDTRRGVITWAIVAPTEAPGRQLLTRRHASDASSSTSARHGVP